MMVFSFQEWVIRDSNNTYIVSEITDSLCPSNNDTEHEWFYATNVRYYPFMVTFSCMNSNNYIYPCIFKEIGK